MKKIIIPGIIFICGLAIAKYFFDVDIEALFEGFMDFVAGVLDGPE